MLKKLLQEKFNCEFPNSFFDLFNLAKKIYSINPLNAFSGERYYPGCTIKLIGPYNILFNGKKEYDALNIPNNFIPIVEGVMGQEYDLIHCYEIKDSKIINISYCYKDSRDFVCQNTTNILDVVKNQVKDDYEYYKNYHWNTTIDINKIEETVKKVLE